MVALDCEEGFGGTENSGFVVVEVSEWMLKGLGVWGGFGFKEDEMVRYEWGE